MDSLALALGVPESPEDRTCDVFVFELRNHLKSGLLLTMLRSMAALPQKISNLPGGVSIRHDPAISVLTVLYSEVYITGELEEGAQLERPWYRRVSQEEEGNLHDIPNEPVDQHAQSKAFARAIALVGDYLRDRQNSLNCQG